MNLKLDLRQISRRTLFTGPGLHFDVKLYIFILISALVGSVAGCSEVHRSEQYLTVPEYPMFTVEEVASREVKVDFHKNSLSGMSICPTGDWLYVLTFADLYKIDCATLEIASKYSITYERGAGLGSLAVSDDGQTLAIYQRQNKIHVLRASDLTLHRIVRSGSSNFRSLPVFGKGGGLFVVLDTGLLEEFDLASGNNKGSWKLQSASPMFLAKGSDQDKLFITYQQSDIISIFGFQQRSFSDGISVSAAGTIDRHNVRAGLGGMVVDDRQKRLYVQSVKSRRVNEMIVIDLEKNEEIRRLEIGFGAARPALGFENRYLFCQDRIVDRTRGTTYTTVVDTETGERFSIELTFTAFVLNSVSNVLYSLRHEEEREITTLKAFQLFQPHRMDSGNESESERGIDE